MTYTGTEARFLGHQILQDFGDTWGKSMEKEGSLGSQRGCGQLESELGKKSPHSLSADYYPTPGKAASQQALLPFRKLIAYTSPRKTS